MRQLRFVVALPDAQQGRTRFRFNRLPLLLRRAGRAGVAIIVAMGMLLVLLMLSPTPLKSDDKAPQTDDDAKPDDCCRAASGVLHCPEFSYGSDNGVWYYDVWKFPPNCFGRVIEATHSADVDVCPPAKCIQCIPGLRVDSGILVQGGAERQQAELREAGKPIQLERGDTKVSSSTMASGVWVEDNGFAKLTHFGKDYYFQLFSILTKFGNEPTRIRYFGQQCTPAAKFQHAELSREQITGSPYVHFLDVRFTVGAADVDMTFRVTTTDPL